MNSSAQRDESVADLDQIFGDVEGLVSPPEVCSRAFEVVESPDSSAEDIAAVVACDPNLTARLLGLVNSSYFNLACQVETISRAVSVLGTRELYNLILALSAVSTFSRIPNSLVNMQTFWRHSIHTGLLARALARRARVLHPERLFVAGLLHDIGSLVLYHRQPNACRDLLLLADGDEEVLWQAEQESFGFDHADLGGHLAFRWQLPPVLCDAITQHHRPGRAAHGQQEAAMVFTANRLANLESESHYAGATFEDPGGWETLEVIESLGEEAVAAARVEAAEQFPSTVRVLTGG